MKRQIAALTIAAFAVLGLAACSSSPAADDKSDTSTSQSESSSAPKEETTSEQSVTEACTEVNAKITAASTELSSIDYAAAQADPENAVATFSATVDAVGEAAESVNNAEVKEAVTAVHEDFVTLRDLLQRVLVDQDTSAASDMTTITADMQESAQAFATLCAAG